MLIENELYDKIREVLPTVCVDLLVTNEQKEYLLANVLRNLHKVLGGFQEVEFVKEKPGKSVLNVKVKKN